LPIPAKLMLEGDELPYSEYCRLASLFPETEVVNGTPLIRQARSVKTAIEIGAYCVTVGSALTRLEHIVSWFAKAIHSAKK
jgi:Xaa-Pro aminopeptidase